MKDIENPLVIDSYWNFLEEASGIENAVNQQECCGIDVYGSEILEGDQIAIDQDNFDEIIIKEDLKRYLVEKMNFIFKGGFVIDKNGFNVLDERLLEKYLHEQYNFKFSIAE